MFGERSLSFFYILPFEPLLCLSNNVFFFPMKSING